jgi:hypothetical protein
MRFISPLDAAPWSSARSATVDRRSLAQLRCLANSGASRRLSGRVGHRRGTVRQRGVAVTGPLRVRMPVPQSAPQSVSCVPLPHPGQRDFPSPVGNECLSRRCLPVEVAGLSHGEHAPVPLGLQRGSPSRRLLPAPAALSHRLGLTASPAALVQGSLAPEALPSFFATTSPCADPGASHRHFSVYTL